MQPYCRPHTPRAHWWVCTNDDGRVTALDLRAVQAGGESLSELRGLSALRYLDLDQNQLTTLPPELGQLQNLTFLNLRANPLRDCLPAGWRGQGVEIWPAVRPPLCTD